MKNGDTLDIVLSSGEKWKVIFDRIEDNRLYHMGCAHEGDDYQCRNSGFFANISHIDSIKYSSEKINFHKALKDVKIGEKFMIDVDSMKFTLCDNEHQISKYRYTYISLDNFGLFGTDDGNLRVFSVQD